jgi:ComF family protein
MFMGRTGPDHLCGHCSRHPWYFNRARSALVFDASLAVLIHRLKYKGRTGLARPLGLLMLGALRENWQPDEIDAVVPIPLHRRRLRMRGFNQARLLASACLHKQPRGPSGWISIPVAEEVLERTRRTASQTGLGRRERIANLKNAFRVRPGKRVANRRLLLVDDVFTTGATANECARVLVKAGARHVDVLTLARTQLGNR